MLVKRGGLHENFIFSVGSNNLQKAGAFKADVLNFL